MSVSVFVPLVVRACAVSGCFCCDNLLCGSFGDDERLGPSCSRKCRHCMSIFKRIWHRCKFCLTETVLFGLFIYFKMLFFSLSFPTTSRSVQQMLFGPHVTRYYKTIQTACRNLIFLIYVKHTNNKPIKQK